MSYLADKELLLYVERDLLPGLAEDCATEIYERFGIVLDHSPASLELIDKLIATETPLDFDTMGDPVGAYFAAVLMRSDGARWSPGFERSHGVDGYRTSRLRLYNEDVDVFGLARQALVRSITLAEFFRQLHHPRRYPDQERWRALETNRTETS